MAPTAPQIAAVLNPGGQGLAHRPMDYHPTSPGRRDAVVTHMCPECRDQASASGLRICPACAGVGTLTTDQLDRWQRKHLAEHRV